MLSPQLADHVNRPRNAGEITGATHYGQSGRPGDGPYVQIWLRIEDGRITAASQRTNGCPAQIASASLMSELVVGRTVEQALRVEPNDIELLLGGMPPGKGGCPKMAVEALRAALNGGTEE